MVSTENTLLAWWTELYNSIWWSDMDISCCILYVTKGDNLERMHDARLMSSNMQDRNHSAGISGTMIIILCNQWTQVKVMDIDPPIEAANVKIAETILLVKNPQAYEDIEYYMGHYTWNCQMQRSLNHSSIYRFYTWKSSDPWKKSRITRFGTWWSYVIYIVIHIKHIKCHDRNIMTIMFFIYLQKWCNSINYTLVRPSIF